MRISKYIEIAEEREIDLSVEEISMMFRDCEGRDEKGAVSCVLSNINTFHSFILGVTNKIIDAIPHETRKIIARVLKEHADRFDD